MNWNALIIAGGKSSGKTTLMNLLLDKDDQPSPSQAIEYNYIKKKDADTVLEIYTSDINSVEMLIQQPRKYIIALTIDLSSKRIDFTQIANFKSKYPHCECIAIGSRLDLYLSLDKEVQRSILTSFQLSCKQFKIQYLYCSQRHPLHFKYLKAYLLYKGLDFEEPEMNFEEFKPEFEIGEITAKQLKSLEQANAKIISNSVDTVQESQLAPEPEVDSYCLQVKERLAVLLSADEKNCTDRIQNVTKIQETPVLRKWEDIFTLLS